MSCVSLFVVGVILAIAMLVRWGIGVLDNEDRYVRATANLAHSALVRRIGGFVVRARYRRRAPRARDDRRA